MKFNPVVRLSLLSLLLFLNGCAIDHANYVKNMEKLNASEYSTIQVGNVQNFTAIKMRVFDRPYQNEISNSDDPGVQAQIANHGNIVYYSDNTAAITLHFTIVPFPDGIDPSWDKFAIQDISETPKLSNFVALGGSIIQHGVTRTDKKDYVAQITDKGSIIHYSDANKSIKLIKRSIPNTENYSNWDEYYLSEDNRYSILKSTKKMIYRLYFSDKEGVEHFYDYIPIYSAVQSTKLGIYRASVYSPATKYWYIFDYLPTKKLICFDLAKAYDTAINSRRQKLTRVAISGILLAIGGSSRTSFNGGVQSSYNGYYAGTHWVNGYARTYDYSYLALGVANLIDTAFKTNASIDNVVAAIEQQQCGFDM